MPAAAPKQTKTRTYNIIAYLDKRTRADIVYWLESQHVSAAVSPLHDSDVWTKADVEAWTPWGTHTERDRPKVGDRKKPHIHIIVTFSGQKTFDQLQTMFLPISDSIGSIQPCKDIKVYTRYLCHLDSPEKAQYSIFEVTPLGNFNLAPLTWVSPFDEFRSIEEMYQFIMENDIQSFDRLVDMAVQSGDMTYLHTITKYNGFWSNYFRGRTYSRTTGGKRKKGKMQAAAGDVAAALAAAEAQLDMSA